MSEKTIQKVNPWTGQKAKAKTDGKFFSILAQHYPHLDQSNTLQNKYKKLSTLIQAPREEPSLAQYKDLIDIQRKISKVDSILEWIQRSEQSDIRKQQPQNNQKQLLIPIDSSFVYLPLHSGNIFNQLLKQSSTMHYQGLVNDRTVKKIQRQIKQMQEILGLNQKIMRNIII